jgi:RNA polymerase sigma factor (sigma-70 family)
MRTDAELLVAAQGDATAFRELYERYAETVFGYHLRRSHDPTAAHDLTAETFAQAWLSRQRFRDEAGGSAGPWIFGIARHVLAASVRRNALERTACERLGIVGVLERAGGANPPEESWLDGVDDMLAELPETQRAAIRLRVIDDLSYHRVAEELDTTSQAARVRVHRGLATLRHRFSATTEQNDAKESAR